MHMDWNWPYPPGDKTEMWFHQDVEIHHADPDEWLNDTILWYRKWFKRRYRPIRSWFWLRIMFALGILLLLLFFVLAVLWPL